MPDSRRVGVVGAGLGGLTACESLRRLGFDGPITIVGDEAELPYDRPPLSKDVLKGTKPNPPRLREREALDGLGLDFRPGTTAIGLDAARRRVALDGGQPLDYDVLIVATGARARPSPVAVGADNVWPLRTSADAARIGRAVQSGARLAVLGAGFIGCEVAASAREMGCPVTLVEMQPAPLSRVLGVQPGKEIAARHIAAGVDVRCGTTIASVSADGGGAVSAITLSDGATIPVDGLVVGLGVTPNVEWLTGAGLVIDDGIVCDSVGATSLDGVYAVGDVARWVNARSGQHARVEHWTTTAEHAAIVAARIVAGEHARRELDEVPYFWSDQYGTKIQCVGEPSASATITRMLTGPDGDRPMYLYSRAGRLVGALGFGLARAVMRLKSLVAEGATVDSARHVLAQLYPVASSA